MIDTKYKKKYGNVALSFQYTRAVRIAHNSGPHIQNLEKHRKLEFYNLHVSFLL